MQAKYVHTNLIAKDWRKLAQFYTDVFGCVFVPPERDYQGDTMDAGTGLKGVHLTGVHLRLPGHGDNGPTIEIFNYNHLETRPKTAVNRPGFAHIAFEVDDLDAALVGHALLSGVSSPSEGVRVAMILDNGVPVELLEFRKTFV